MGDRIWQFKRQVTGMPNCKDDEYRVGRGEGGGIGR